MALIVGLEDLLLMIGKAPGYYRVCVSRGGVSALHLAHGDIAFLGRDHDWLPGLSCRRHFPESSPLPIVLRK